MHSHLRGMLTAFVLNHVGTCERQDVVCGADEGSESPEGGQKEWSFKVFCRKASEVLECSRSVPTCRSFRLEGDTVAEGWLPGGL